MRWYLVYEEAIPVEISFEDMLKVKATYPSAPIVREDQLQEYLAYQRTRMIYG